MYLLKVISGLYLGNFKDAKNQIQLQTNGITHIVSIHESPKPFYEVRLLQLTTSSVIFKKYLKTEISIYLNHFQLTQITDLRYN